MSISFGALNQGVRQVLHLRQEQAPETREPGAKPGILSQLAHPLVVKNNPLAAAAPKQPDALKVLSFNVRLGGLDYPGIAKTVTGAKADVVCLQEVSRASAEQLAKSLGLHLAFYQSVRHNNDITNGKAILSRFPIKQAESVPFKLSIGDRLGAMWAKFRQDQGSVWQRLVGTVSLWQKRNILRATVAIGGKQVDILDIHLSTGAPANAGKQYAQLEAYVKARKAQGHEVILAGDFNTRHDRAPGTAPDLRGWTALNGQLADAYAAAPVTVRGLDGVVRTPAQGRAALDAGGLDARQRDVMTRTALGATSSAGNGRIDGILSTPGFVATGVYIDQANDASDHEPVLADFAIRP